MRRCAAISPSLRDELCKVLIDRYANGREVLRALLDALADGSGSDSTRTFVGAISGSTVAGRDWISEGRRALLEKIYQMDESAENAIDSACAEIATQAAALAVAYGKSGGKFDAASVFATRPDRAISVLGDAMRAEAATRFLAEPFPSSVDEIERQRNARRSLAASVTQRMAAETAGVGRVRGDAGCVASAVVAVDAWRDRRRRAACPCLCAKR